MPYEYFASLARALIHRTYTITRCAPAYPLLTEVRVQQLAHAEAGTIYRNHQLTTTAFAQSTAASDVTYTVGNSQLASFLATIETFGIVRAEARAPALDPITAILARRLREQEEQEGQELVRRFARELPPPAQLGSPNFRRPGK